MIFRYILFFCLISFYTCCAQSATKALGNEVSRVMRRAMIGGSPLAFDCPPLLNRQFSKLKPPLENFTAPSLLKSPFRFNNNSHVNSGYRKPLVHILLPAGVILKLYNSNFTHAEASESDTLEYHKRLADQGDANEQWLYARMKNEQAKKVEDLSRQ